MSSEPTIPEDAAPERRHVSPRTVWRGPDDRADLLSLSPEALEALLLEMGERSFRAKQIWKWVHQRLATSFEEMTDLKKSLREALSERAAMLGPRIESVKASRDGTRKYQLRTHDGHVIESVFIPDASGPGKNALCISSQVGCAMACTFCATAALKLKRHLSPGEIAGQLYAVTRDLQQLGIEGAEDDEGDEEDGPGVRPAGKRPRPITNIVYMGMGEPLHNYAGVVDSIRMLTSPEGQCYSPRRITVSTSGLVPAILRLGEDTDVHIAISLNATTDEVRSQVMPVNKRWPIEALLRACRDFPLKARRRITFEYVMLAGVNDTDADARRLVGLMRGLRSKVNLIPFNAHPLSSFERPDDARVRAFQRILDDAQISTFVRTTRGLDIDAACGMLGAKKLEEARGQGLPVVP